jgi:hypothetical protein
MGQLRKLFGPSREEIWRQFSAAVDGQFIDGGLWKGDKVQAAHGPWTVTLDTYTVHTNKAHMTFTRMRAPYVNPDGFRFTIYRETIFSEIAKWFGMQDVRTGHEHFDSEFVVKGTNEAKVRYLFDNPKIRELAAAQPQIHFTVKDDEGWFGPDFPEGADELYFSVLGVIKDKDRLKKLYELFAETLDELCRIGSAYEGAPNVELT